VEPVSACFKYLRIDRKGGVLFCSGTTGNKDIKLSSIDDIQSRKLSFVNVICNFCSSTAKNKGIEMYFLDRLVYDSEQSNRQLLRNKVAIEKHKNNSHSDKQ